jgi:pimeloyl-ACP methyl ester carboxylesterase
MPHVEANGLRFHVQVLRAPVPPPTSLPSGRHPKVVMLHGLVADNLSSYYYTIANPVGLVADTYLYDLRGHGRSEMPPSGYTVGDHVADLDALLARWQIDDDEPVHLVGNSFGGVVALSFAHRFPRRVASLVLIEAHFATEGWGEHMAGSLALAAFGLDEAGVKDWLARNATRKLSRMARHSERLFLETSLIDDLQRERPFPNQALQAIDCPTLAIYGAHSDILDRAYDLERHLPRCELHVVEGCSHSVLFEAAPFVREHTLAWLDQHAAVAT